MDTSDSKAARYVGQPAIPRDAHASSNRRVPIELVANGLSMRVLSGAAAQRARSVDCARRFGQAGAADIGLEAEYESRRGHLYVAADLPAAGDPRAMQRIAIPGYVR